MRNTNVFHYAQHSCWDPIPSEQKGHLCIPTRYLHSIIQRSLETSGMVGSWKASHVAGERGEKDDNETKEREGACELS